MILRTIILLTFLSSSCLLKAQVQAGSDELFKAARVAAFDEKNNNKAMQLSKQALLQSPEYADVQVFLGRLYSWNKQYDSAVHHYRQVLTYAPVNEDVHIAYADLEYWNKNYDKGLLICNQGLSANPASAELLLRKAKILIALKQRKAALAIINQLLLSDKKNSEALTLALSLKDAGAINNIHINYDYSHFDKQIQQPWHLASIGYSRNTNRGSLFAKINYANYFGRSGWQGELEGYPKINKTFYSYINIAYSPGETVFPKFRAGFSLFANLNKAFEAEAGLRYLNFGSSTNVYTFYIGKYYQNLLFGARTYITPGSGGATQSYNLLARYYLKGVENYIGVSVGSGISPDDRATSLQYNTKNKFTTRQASASFNHSLDKLNIIAVKAGWLRQQNETSESLNQLTFSVGFQSKF